MNYYVMFDRSVSWSENMKIVAWISLYSGKNKLDKWFHLQCIKEESTLRVSSKEQSLLQESCFVMVDDKRKSKLFCYTGRPLRKL